MMNFALSIIEKSLDYPSKTAIIDGFDSITYYELAKRIPLVATKLNNLGLLPGDHVIINMKDSVDWPVIFLACVYANIVPLPLSNTIGSDLFWYITDFIECKAIITDNLDLKQKSNIKIITRLDIQSSYHKNNQILDPVMVHPDSKCWMNISSGSTGTPKVAVHRHQNLYEILELSPSLSYSMTSDSKILSIAKMSWNFGLHNSITYPLWLGATAVVIPDPPAASTIFDYINRYNPTIVVTSPSIIKRLLHPSMSRYQLSKSIQHFHSGGEHLPEPIYDKFLERFEIKLNSCIGMMETSTNYCANPDWDHDKCTVGKPLPKCKVKLINEAGDNCQDNQVGEIYVSSPASAHYYYKNYEKTKQTFIGEWVKTGDLAYWNDRKNLVFVGRVDDVFKVNDLIVSPVEIESTILKNAMVDQVAVTGVKNSKSVTEVHVFVVPNVQFELTEFKNFLSQSLFAHQVPKKIHIVDSLLETITNKKDRRALAGTIKNVTKL